MAALQTTITQTEGALLIFLQSAGVEKLLAWLGVRTYDVRS